MTTNGYTSHGHRIDGVLQVGKGPTRIARCGGEGLCGLCSNEAVRARASVQNKDKALEKILVRARDYGTGFTISCDDCDDVLLFTQYIHLNTLVRLAGEHHCI